MIDSISPRGERERERERKGKEQDQACMMDPEGGAIQAEHEVMVVRRE